MPAMTLFTGPPKKRCGYVAPLYLKTQCRAHTTPGRTRKNTEANMLLDKDRYFEAEWQANFPLFLIKSKQGRYEKQLLREAKKVSKLPMSVKCYTTEGLQKIGIRAKTATNMDKLVRDDTFWCPPHTKSDALYLTLNYV